MGDPGVRGFVLDIVGRFLHMHLTPLAQSASRWGSYDSRLRAGPFWTSGYWRPPRSSRYPLSASTFTSFSSAAIPPPARAVLRAGHAAAVRVGTLAPRVERRRVAGTLAATMFVVLSGTAIWCFVESSVFLLYRPNNLNTTLIDAGRAIDEATPNGSLLVVVEYERAGSNSPMLLYYARRRGWSFDALAIRPTVVDYLRDKRGPGFSRPAAGR